MASDGSNEACHKMLIVTGCNSQHKMERVQVSTVTERKDDVGLGWHGTIMVIKFLTGAVLPVCGSSVNVNSGRC